jgi:flagellar protein FliS
MYANYSPFASRAQRASSAYSKVNVESGVLTASPHRLVSMLFEGLSESMNLAHGAIESGNLELKIHNISRAIRILDEGLKATLNLEAGPLAADLKELYSYICVRLTQANLRNDSAAIEECVRLLRPVREAWESIGPDASPQARFG